MNNRIVQLRKSRDWTQDKFAEEMRISKNYVSLIENGRKVPSDRLVSDICREFNVTEDWLRNGKGDMYNVPEDEVATVVSDLLEENHPFYSIIISIMKSYRKLDDKSKLALNDLIQKLLNGMKEGD